MVGCVCISFYVCFVLGVVIECCSLWCSLFFFLVCLLVYLFFFGVLAGFILVDCFSNLIMVDCGWCFLFGVVLFYFI